MREEGGKCKRVEGGITLCVRDYCIRLIKRKEVEKFDRKRGNASKDYNTSLFSKT